MITIFAIAIIVIAFITILSSSIVSIFAYSIFSLFTAILYLILKAPDVAITEAAVGSAISSIFFILTIRAIDNNIAKDRVYTTKDKKLKIAAKNISISGNPILFICLSIIIFAAMIDIFNQISGIQNDTNEISQYYINNSLKDNNSNNIVTSILASYRGFDTLIETTVIFIASIGVYVILNTEDEKES